MGGHQRVIRVLVVDGEEVARRGVIAALAADACISVVGEAATVRQAVVRGAATRPDVVVLAMRLPDGSGARVCERLRALVPGVRVLVLTIFDDGATVREAVRAGASGYLVKAVGSRTLLAAVRATAAGRAVFDASVRAALSRPAEDVRDRLARLTLRERAVLQAIGEGLPNRVIGHRLGLAEKTVKNYTSSLLDKLGLDNRTQAAVVATRLRGGPDG